MNRRNFLTLAGRVAVAGAVIVSLPSIAMAANKFDVARDMSRNLVLLRAELEDTELKVMTFNDGTTHEYMATNAEFIKEFDQFINHLHDVFIDPNAGLVNKDEVGRQVQTMFQDKMEINIFDITEGTPEQETAFAIGVLRHMMFVEDLDINPSCMTSFDRFHDACGSYVSAAIQRV